MFGGIPGLDQEANSREQQFIGDSTCVASASFKYPSTLVIQFQDGSTYSYFNVHPFHWYNMLRSLSKGQYFNAHIRNAGYVYEMS